MVTLGVERFPQRRTESMKDQVMTESMKEYLSVPFGVQQRSSKAGGLVGLPIPLCQATDFICTHCKAQMPPKAKVKFMTSIHSLERPHGYVDAMAPSSEDHEII